MPPACVAEGPAPRVIIREIEAVLEQSGAAADSGALEDVAKQLCEKGVGTENWWLQSR